MYVMALSQTKQKGSDEKERDKRFGHVARVGGGFGVARCGGGLVSG